MAPPVLYDTVTLWHFAAAGRLDICQAHCSSRDEPRWTHEVHDEVLAAHNAGGEDYLADILATGWLGEPVTVASGETLDVYRIQVGLNDGRQPPTAHLGEAASIFMAEKLDGIFASDDNGAYDFASRRPGLGPARVIDTIYILNEMIAMGDLTRSDAASVARSIADAGRDLRRCHPARPSADYFD